MTTTTLNDALVKLDNVITAANYLLDELQTRKQELLHKNSILEEVKFNMNSPEFKNDVYHYVRDSYGSGISREVAFYVMERIDSDIEQFINNRVEKAIEAAGISVNSQ